MGRSGSTLVWDAVREGVATARFGPFSDLGLRLVSDTAWDFGEQSLVPGVVYKSHGLAHELPANCNAKVIFVFGPATAAAMSVHACRDIRGERWVKEHLRHLRATGDLDELPDRDVLRFGEQLRGWAGLTGVRRLLLHYDAIWDSETEISEFVGARISLPERQARTGHAVADPQLQARFRATYAELDRLIADMPKCQVLD